MVKKKIKPIAVLLIALFFAVGFLLTIGAIEKKYAPAAMPLRQIEDYYGNTLNAVSIEDVNGVQSVTAVNYCADTFILPPHGDTATEYSDDYENISNRGSFQLIFLNLDPNDEHFSQKAETLDPYLSDGYSWRFSLYIPPIFSACNIYVRSALSAQAGEISDYEFISYSDKQGYTERHKNGTEPLFLDISLYSKRNTMSPDPYENACVVTIHYEADGNRLAGFNGRILFGEEVAVHNAVTRDSLFLYATGIFAAAIFALFVFVCILFRSAEFFPQLILVAGIAGVMICGYLFTEVLAAPYLVTALKGLFYGLVLLGATLAVNGKIKKIDLRPLAGICCILAFAAPFTSVPVCNAIYVALKILYGISAVAVPASAVFSSACGKRSALLLNSVFAPVCLAYAIFAAPPFPAILSPSNLLCIIMLSVTVYIGLREFILLQKKNRYLTGNLKAEVARQTEDLQSVLNERDGLLQYVSHDLRKPIRSIENYLSVLRERESNGEQIKTIDTIKNKTADVSSALNEISRYAKQNFIAEQSENLSLNEIIDDIYESLSPDCEANGIRLHCAAAKITVFAKRICLVSILNNLIMNAIEHAECNAIFLTAVKKRNICRISVSDNGKGLPDGRDIFRPYYSENEGEENLGLGLYVCRRFAESMNGTLNYTQSAGMLTFTLSLPLA